jgi:hypothetical protein
MRKKVLIGVSICAVVLFILGSSTTVVGYQTVQSSAQNTISTYDNVTVFIRAGMRGKTNGNYGIGILVGAGNQLERSVECHFIAYWNTTDDTNKYTYDNWFTVPPYLNVGIGFGYGSRFHPIYELTVTVEVIDPSICLTRTGVQIGRVVFFSE